MSNPFRTDPHPDLTAAIRGVVHESHTRAQLEKLSITQLRALLKRYSAKPGSGRELADIRGLLRARGAGSVLDEGRKGLGKTRYGKALAKMGAAVAAYNKSPKPKPPVNPFKTPVQEETLNEGGMKAAIEDFMYDTLTAAAVRDLQPVFKNTAIRGAQLRARVAGVLKRHGVPSMALGTSSAQIVIDNFDTFFGEVNESAPTTAAEWTAANRPSRETAKALQAGMKKFLSKYGKPKPAKPAAAPVREGASPCEQGALDAVRRANAADLKEYPGKRGERAHKRLHKTIGKILKQ